MMTKKILFIKRAALGDILMATPLIRQLKSQVANVQLDFLVSEEFSKVLKNNQYIDNLITLPADTFSKRKIFCLIKFVITLRNRYDYVFVLDKHYYFNFIARLISKNTVGYLRDPISRLFLRYRVRYKNIMHYHGFYYLDLLAASKLGVPDYTDCQLDFNVSTQNIQAIEKIMQEYSLEKDKFSIIINSGGNNKFESNGIRMLPENKILELINKVSINSKVVLLGGVVDEINYNNYLKLIDAKNVINLAGKLSLEQSAVIMNYAYKIYTSDCGAMHIAITQGVFSKLCCFFGPTCPQHVLPPKRNIEYYWADFELFDKFYPLNGIMPKSRGYFAKLDVDKLFLDNTDETKKLY